MTTITIELPDLSPSDLAAITKRLEAHAARLVAGVVSEEARKGVCVPPGAAQQATAVSVKDG